MKFGTFKSKYIAKSFKQNLNFKGAIKIHPMNLTGRAVANYAFLLKFMILLQYHIVGYHSSQEDLKH